MARICSFLRRASILRARIASRILRNRLRLVADEHQLGDLLRDGRAALHDAARFQVGERGAHDAHRIDAVVLEEAIVLGSDERCLHVLGQQRVGQDDALLQEELADELAFGGKDAAGA